MNDTIRVARCVSLSMGGAGLRSQSPLLTGSVLTLRLRFGSKRMHALAQVVRCDGSEVGVRFLQLHPDAMGTILSKLH